MFALFYSLVNLERVSLPSSGRSHTNRHHPLMCWIASMDYPTQSMFDLYASLNLLYCWGLNLELQVPTSMNSNVLVRTYDPSTGETEAGKSLGLWASQPV